MKRVLSVMLCAALLLGASACGKQQNDGGRQGTQQKQEQNVYKTLDPEKILTLEEVSQVVEYAPVEKTEKTRKKATVLYCSEPIGKGDIIQVDLYQPSDSISEEEVRRFYDEIQEKRTKAEAVEDLGCEAFIAIPSIHLMKDGYHVAITAGSGGGDEQKALLKKLAQIAIGNMDELLQ